MQDAIESNADVDGRLDNAQCVIVVTAEGYVKGVKGFGGVAHIPNVDLLLGKTAQQGSHHVTFHIHIIDVAADDLRCHLPQTINDEETLEYIAYRNK